MLFIRPIQARLTRETNILLSMDPYCIIIYEGKQYRTNPHIGGGQKPKWNDTLSFDIKTINLLRIQVWSRSVIGNDALIGRAEIDLRRLMLVPGRTTQEHIELFFEGKSAGKILVQITFAAQAFKKKQLIQPQGIIQQQPQRVILPPPLQKINTFNPQQLYQQQKVQAQNRLLPSDNMNGFVFPHRQNNQLYGSQAQTLEQDLINNMAKMNLNGEYFQQPKPQILVPPGQMNGLAHRRLQRPTTPQYQIQNNFNKPPTNNGIIVTQPLHESLPVFPTNELKQSLVDEKLDSSFRNSFDGRENRFMSNDEKTQQVKSEQNIKPILSKGKDKKRSRSNKKVSFNV